MTSNHQETLKNLIQKYNLIKLDVNELSDEFYRIPFPKSVEQYGYLLRFDKTVDKLITARSVRIDGDGDLVYLDTTLYDPHSFEILIKDCYNILKSIKESQLQKKLHRIDEDF
jgi:site-specific DNA-adenine methylase